MDTHKLKFLLVFIGIVAAAVGVGLYNYTPLTSMLTPSLPYPATKFVGRQQEVSELLDLLQYTTDSPRIVSITGAPGFGKSTLAIHVGHMLADRGINVIYINMNEVTSKHALADTIITTSEKTISGGNVTISYLYQWSKQLKSQTLLILDNCDEQFHSNKDVVQNVVTGLVKNSLYKTFKILTTSRQQVTYIQQHQLYIIRELSSSHACELLLGITKSLDNTLCGNISSLTGSVPLALHVVGALLNMPDSPHPQLILHQLEQNLIGTLSPLELQNEDRVNASIYLSYQHLDSDMQKVGRYLSYFPGSFDADAASQIVFPNRNGAENSLKLLVRRSLLDYSKQTNRYIYHRLIREFFKNMSTPTESGEFYMHYLQYYTSALETMAQKGFIEALQIFYVDKHNFKHCFDQFTVLPIDDMKIVETYITLADTIGKYPSTNHILIYGFQFYELHGYIETFLSCLEQVNKLIIKGYSKDKFVQIYSSVVLYLKKIEQSFIRDKNKLLDGMIKYQWIFMKHGQLVPTPQYIEFFSTLAMYYKELNNPKMEKSCHKRVLRRKMVLEKCEEDECSNFELAKAFIFAKDYEKSVYYCDKTLQSIKTLSLLDFDSAIAAADVLVELYDIFSTSSHHHRMDEVTAKLCDMVNNIQMVEPLLVINHARSITRIIYLLETVDRTAESEKLKDGLTKGIMKWFGDVSILIGLMSSLFDEHNYKMVILIGETVIKSGNIIFVDKVKFFYYNLAQSYFLLQNYTESDKYYHIVVTLPGFDHFSYKSCSQLVMLCSFVCFYPFSGAKLILHFMKTIYANFFPRIFSHPWTPEQKTKSQYSGMDKDFLTTDLSISETNVMKLGQLHKFQSFFDNVMLYLYNLSHNIVIYPVVVLFRIAMVVLNCLYPYLFRSLLSHTFGQDNFILGVISAVFFLIFLSLYSLLEFIASGCKCKLCSLCTLLFVLLLIIFLFLSLLLSLLFITIFLVLNNYYFYFINY